jgi:hypothetical protein
MTSRSMRSTTSFGRDHQSVARFGEGISLTGNAVAFEYLPDAAPDLRCSQRQTFQAV